METAVKYECCQHSINGADKKIYFWLVIILRKGKSMKLKIEKWVEDTNSFDDSVYELFMESINNYKIGSYRSAFIMAYLSFKLTIRNRIVNCSYGRELKKKNPNFWKCDILDVLENDDKWEEKINEIVLASCVSLKERKDIGILNFKNNETAKTEYSYWKEKRNACVHGKNQIIDSSTVENFWNYLMDNLCQFYVLGGEEYLLRELTDIYEYYKYPDISNRDGMSKLLYDIGAIYQDHTENYFSLFLDKIKGSRSYVDDENKGFWNTIIHFNQEKIVDGFVKSISDERLIFFELYEFFPELLEKIVVIRPKFIVADLSDWLKNFKEKNKCDGKKFWCVLVGALSKYGEQVNIDPIINDNTICLVKDVSDKNGDVEILNKYGVFKKYLLNVSDWYFKTDGNSQFSNFGYKNFSDVEICFSLLQWDTDCLDRLDAALCTFKESFPLRQNTYSIQNGRIFMDSCKEVIKTNQEKIKEAMNANGSSYKFINQVMEGTYLEN